MLILYCLVWYLSVANRTDFSRQWNTGVTLFQDPSFDCQSKVTYTVLTWIGFSTSLVWVFSFYCDWHSWPEFSHVSFVHWKLCAIFCLIVPPSCTLNLQSPLLIQMSIIISVEVFQAVELDHHSDRCDSLSPFTFLFSLSLSHGGRDENGCLITQRGQPIKGLRPSDLKALS